MLKFRSRRKSRSLMIWHDKEDQKLRQLISERYSLSEIAQKMGTTRGSVSGRCNRLGLRLISRSFAKQNQRPNNNVGNGITVADRIVAKAKLKQAVVEKVEPADDECPQSKNVPFAENFGCSAITDQVKNTCCGHQPVPGKSYCPYHHKLYSMGLPQRRTNVKKYYPR